MFAVTERAVELSGRQVPETSIRELKLDSTIEELTLYNFHMESSKPGKELAKAFSENPLMPGAILTEQGEFVGIISRRRFLEHLSRPYGVELFSRRPIKALYNFTKTEVSILASNSRIVEAARQSLQRSPALLYEPVVVEKESQGYRLLDVHQLLVAQSHIQELTAKMLHEQSRVQMIQTEKMASLGRMVAGVAHEIRNPVNCIGGNMGFLTNYCQELMELLSTYEEEVAAPSAKIIEVQEKIDLNFLRDDLPKIIKTIEVGAERLTKIVGGMQNFSHMDEANRKPADLHECIDSTLLILNNRVKYGIEVIKNYGNLPAVDCYSGQLSQVFMNIISNAIDALVEKEDEQKDIAAADENWQPRLEIATEVIKIEGKHWVVIRIGDNGPGIPPEIQTRIFETFFTTKPVGKGTGLGLAISNEIVREKHGGQLNLKSQPGGGTQFEILLPLA